MAASLRVWEKLGLENKELRFPMTFTFSTTVTSAGGTQHAVLRAADIPRCFRLVIEEIVAATLVTPADTTVAPCVDLFEAQGWCIQWQQGPTPGHVSCQQLTDAPAEEITALGDALAQLANTYQLNVGLLPAPTWHEALNAPAVAQDVTVAVKQFA